MSDETETTIVPTRKDVECWRLSAEWFVKFGGVKLGEFNWPQAVMSLAAEWKKNNAQDEGAGIMAEITTTTDVTGPMDTTSAKLARWLSIATREAMGTEGYKLYPGDWAALASLLREVRA